MTTDLDVLADQLADAEAAWSLGTFGAIAEFTRDRDEPVQLNRSHNMISAVTARGGLRLKAHPEMRPIASESPTTESWNHRVALCLPEQACAMNRRTVLTEVGPDRDALRAADRANILFDLGLGALHVDICIRSSDPTLIHGLRSCAGQSVFASGNAAMGLILASQPHRVFMSRLGRIEVFQPIPPPDGKSPDGPHTHVLPKLLAHGRTHSANEPTPAGWIPCAHCYPPNPIRDSYGKSRMFQSDYHSAFQKLLDRYGDPQLFAIKQRVVQAVAAGHPPTEVAASDRFGRGVVRVALRQLWASEQLSATLGAWLSAHDRYGLEEAEDSREAHH
jgi:hypothetical protein